MRTETRLRGAVLSVLDVSAICAKASAQLDNGETYHVSFGPYAVGYQADGKMVVVCAEGVGWVVTDERLLELDLYRDTDENSMAILPSFTANLSPSEIAPHITDEKIDLADLVREHGSRLRENFWTLRAILR